MKFVVSIVVFFLVLLGITLLFNLIGIGTQEHFLNHPGYPEGDDFKQDVQQSGILIGVSLVCIVGLIYYLVRYYKRL